MTAAKRIYLDNAATSFPKPQSVYEKAFDFMKDSAGNPGRGAHYYSDASALLIENTRRQTARFFGIPDPKQVVFTYNCTDSINMVLKGWVKSGSHVITTALDHNSVTRPVQSLQKRQEVEVTRIAFDKHGRVDAQQLRREVRNNTALIVLTHGSNVLGSVQDLQQFVRVSRETGIPLLVDAAQTAGHIPISIEDAPVFLACSVHKGLLGMPGLGILTVPPGYTLEAWREGGSGSASESPDHPEELPLHLEAGTPNTLAIASLYASLEFIQQQTIERIHSKESSLAQQLFSGLAELGCKIYSSVQDPRLPIVSFNVRDIPSAEVAAILDQTFGIAVRGGLHCAGVLHNQLQTVPGGCLRASPGYFNTEDDVDALIDAVKKISEQY